jgi:hypothetical protein
MSDHFIARVDDTLHLHASPPEKAIPVPDACSVTLRFEAIKLSLALKPWPAALAKTVFIDGKVSPGRDFLTGMSVQMITNMTGVFGGNGKAV